jgi:hemolysin activation/secretion protein
VQGDVFARGAGEITISRGLGSHLAAAVTVAGGISEKAPPQRNFFLGGTPTVRGQLAGTAVGDAYWLGRLELGGAKTSIKPVIFGDIGWAGPRDLWRTPGKPVSGAGVGVSFFDGLIRADLARGIYPRERFRFDMYLEGRF